VVFLDCLIEKNDGFFMVMNPSDKNTDTLLQYMRFRRCIFQRNSVRNYAMIHVMRNCQLDFFASYFEENIGFGRGVITYSEMDYSYTYIEGCLFRRNRGYQGGVFYAET
jgi:hypothetical protein